MNFQHIANMAALGEITLSTSPLSWDDICNRMLSNPYDQGRYSRDNVKRFLDSLVNSQTLRIHNGRYSLI